MLSAGPNREIGKLDFGEIKTLKPVNLHFLYNIYTYIYISFSKLREDTHKKIIFFLVV